MSRTDVDHTEPFNDQNPNEEPDGDKKPKSRRPASESIFKLRLCLLSLFHIDIEDSQNSYLDTAFRQQRLKAWQ